MKMKIAILFLSLVLFNKAHSEMLMIGYGATKCEVFNCSPHKALCRTIGSIIKFQPDSSINTINSAKPIVRLDLRLA